MGDKRISSNFWLLSSTVCLLRLKCALLVWLSSYIIKRVRRSTFKGKVLRYPNFSSVDEAFKYVQILVDQYNLAFDKISLITNDALRMDFLFRLAAWFLFEFLGLHPFSDGNGRVARMLCSYILMTVTPFPTPIYNIYSETTYSDYVQSKLYKQYMYLFFDQERPANKLDLYGHLV